MNPDLNVVVVPVVDLVPDPENARKHSAKNLDAIAGSLRLFGQRRPLVVHGQVVIAGNGTLEAAKSLGWSHVAITRTPADWSVEQARAYALADNRTAELAAWDDKILADQLVELDAVGWDVAAIGFEPLQPPVNPLEEDQLPPVPDEPITRPGDLWILGRHRVLCADATVKASYSAVLRDESADCIWTDPPYNVAVVGGTHDPRDVKNHGKGPRIQNDNMSDAQFRQFLLSAFSEMYDAARPGSPIYVCHADTEGVNFRTTFMEAGFFLHQVLIWVKQEFVFGRSDYHWQHEPILYGWKKGSAHEFFGPRNQSTTWTIDRPMRSGMEHPTQKPLALPAKALENSSRSGDVILDPFGGSGSTLIACEQSNRQARLIELDPRYVDVIVERWQALTGEKAMREHD